MNDHFETPICPNCGHTIIEIETVDAYNDVDNTEYVVLGTCPNCHKNYSWLDHYEHAYCYDLEEEEEEEED